jgi:DNA-binding Lrp family transcriptional regulator
MSIKDRNNDKVGIKLDLKDKKMLFELDFNGRESYTQLAKKIRLSKQGTEYKLKSLISKKIIKGFYPVINVPKLGFHYCRLLLTLQNTDQEKIQEISNYLTQHKKVFWLFKMQGTYDFLIVIWAKSIIDFQSFTQELVDKYGEYIKKKIENIMTDVIHYQHRYLLNNTETKEIHIKETNERIELDALDKNILQELCSDARTSLVSISEKTKESAKVIGNRLKILEKKKLIEGYRPIVDHNRIGFTYYKVFLNLNKTAKDDINKLKSYIKNNPIVIYMIEGVSLPGDLDIEIMVASNKQLYEFIDGLRNTFPALVGEYQTVIFMDTLKVRYLPD